MKNYEIGQVIFLLDKENMSIFPVRIVKEVSTKTITQVITTYTVELQDLEGKGTTFSIPKKNLQDFQNVSDAREHMIFNATKAIDEICEKAFRWKVDLYDKDPTVLSEKNTENIVQVNSTVLLDNGMKVHLPASLSEL